jgi:hypothetical protein
VFNSVAISVRSAKAHARVTNNLRELAGVDGRSSDGKRFRDLLDMAVEEFGQHDPLKLRELAALRFSLEKVVEAVVAGDTLRAEDQVRLANLISRREKELRAKARQREAEPREGLRSRLAGRYDVKGRAP